MSYRVSTSSLVAAEPTHIWTPRNPRPTSKNPVLICHSSGSTDDGVGTALPNFTTLASVLARGSAQSAGQGMPVIAGYMSGKYPWANDTAISRITAMITQIGTSSGADVSKVHMVGVSMGAASCLRYAALNPTKVASLNLVIPAASILSVYAQNPGYPIAGPGGASSIATAWGLSYVQLTVTLTNGSPNMVATVGSFTSPMGTRHDLIIKNTGNRQSLDNTVPIGTTVQTFTDATHATMSANFTGTTGSYAIAVAQPLPTSGSPNADLLGLAPAIASAAIPTRLFYSTADQYVDPADVTAMAAATGGTATVIDTTLGHVNGTIGAWASYNGTLFSDLVSNLVAHNA